MENLILWLDGKKMIISGCVAVVIGYLATAGAIDTNLSTAILAILNILFGSVQGVANYAIKDQTSTLGMALINKRSK